MRWRRSCAFKGRATAAPSDSNSSKRRVTRLQQPTAPLSPPTVAMAQWSQCTRLATATRGEAAFHGWTRGTRGGEDADAPLGPGGWLSPRGAAAAHAEVQPCARLPGAATVAAESWTACQRRPALARSRRAGLPGLLLLRRSRGAVWSHRGRRDATVSLPPSKIARRTHGWPVQRRRHSLLSRRVASSTCSAVY